MGGVVELNTRRQTDPGLHGTFVLSGDGYATLSGYGQLQQTRTKDDFGVSASGSETGHSLNPVVPENYTNTGTAADFAGSCERDLSQIERLSLSGRRELSRFLIPNTSLAVSDSDELRNC
jgi:hypothetical protein